MLGLLDDSQKRARLGAAGQAYVQARFGLDAVFAQYLRLFEELLGAPVIVS